jgi:hypothetical protein
MGRRNDESEETRKLFKGVWEEIGTNSVVQLYLKEVLEALTESIGAASWALKKQGALTLAEVVESQSNVNAITPYLESLFALLLTGLKGRTWNGTHDTRHTTHTYTHTRTHDTHDTHIFFLQ